MRNRLPRRLAEAGMSLERYMSLKWTCKEYDKARESLEKMRDTLRATAYKGGGGRSGKGDPTARAVEKIMKTPEFFRVNAIEQAAIATDAAVYHAILENVCRGKAYGEIFPRPWCGERQFYARCVEFFIELDELL